MALPKVLWSGRVRVYGASLRALEWPESPEVSLARGFRKDEGFFQNRRMWRLLLARLHPDAGGDHELFLFACAVMEGAYGGPGVGQDAAGQDRSFSAWRVGMSSWATSNREGLRRPASPRRHR